MGEQLHEERIRALEDSLTYAAQQITRLWVVADEQRARIALLESRLGTYERAVEPWEGRDG